MGPGVFFPFPRAGRGEFVCGLSTDVAWPNPLRNAQYGVKFPNLYAVPSKDISQADADAFNAVQRGHQNMIETAAAHLSFVLLAGVFEPQWAFQCTLAWGFGRLVYAFGYSIKPTYRIIGELFYLPATIALAYSAYASFSALA